MEMKERDEDDGPGALASLGSLPADGLLDGFAEVQDSTPSQEKRHSAFAVPSHMSQIRMAPSHSCQNDNRNSFCYWHDDQHQTIPKVLAGAPREEKMDEPKPCNDGSSDKGGPEPDSSLQSVNSFPRRLPNKTSALKIVDKNSKCFKNRNVRKRAELNSLEENKKDQPQPTRSKTEEQFFLDDPDHKNFKRTEEDGETYTSRPEQKENAEQPNVDNRLLEELHSLPLQEVDIRQIEDIANSHKIGTASEVIRECIELWKGLERGVSLLPSTESMKETIKTLLENMSKAEIEKEIEKQESESSEKLVTEQNEEKRDEWNNSLKMASTSQKDQPLEKTRAMQWAQYFSQHNRLTNRVLTRIYSCYREQVPANVFQQNSVSQEWKKLFSLTQSMTDRSSSLETSLKEESYSLVSLGEQGKESKKSENVKDSQNEDHSLQQHLSDLPVTCFRLPMEPVENTFHFSMSTASFDTFLTRFTDSTSFMQNCFAVRALLHSLICSAVISGVEKRELKNKRELKDVEKLAQVERESEYDKAKPEEQEKAMEDKMDMAEIAEKADDEEVKLDKGTSTDNIVETLVLEKSEIEELEKTKKGEHAAVTEKPAEGKSLQSEFTVDGTSQERSAGEPQPLKKQTADEVGRNQTYSKNQQRGKQQSLQHFLKEKRRSSKNKRKGGNKDKTGRRFKQLMSASSPSERQGTVPQMNLTEQTSKMETANDPLSQAADTLSDQRICMEEMRNSLPEEEQSLNNSAYSELDVLASVDEFSERAEQSHEEEDSHSGQESCQRLNKRDGPYLLKTEELQDSYSSARVMRGKSVLPPRFTVNSVDAKEALKERICTKKGSCQHDVQKVPPMAVGKAQTPGKGHAGKPGGRNCLGSRSSPLVKDGSSFLTQRPKRVDLHGAVFTVMVASDGGASGAGRSGHGGNSASQGGGNSEQGFGGARPRTNRNGNSGSGEDPGGDGDDNRPPGRNVPVSLPLGFTTVDPSGQGPVPPRNYKRHRKKQHGAISNEQLCHCLGQAGLGLSMLQQSSGVRELDQCLMLCLHQTSTVTSPTVDDLMCCTCAILHSLLSHFSSAAHNNTCNMCQQLFTLVQFHVMLCLAGCRDHEKQEDPSHNICYKMRQARLFADDAATSSSTKVWGKVRKYLSAVLGSVLLLDMNLEEETMGQAGLGDQYEPLPHTADYAVPEDLQGTAPGAVSHESLPQAAVASAEGLAQSAAAFPKPGVGHLPQGSGDSAQSHAAVKPSQGSGLRRRPSTRVIPQKTIPEEPVSPQPPVSPAGEQGEEPSAVNLVEALPIPKRAETPDENEDIMSYIHSFAKISQENKSSTLRHVSDDPYATQKIYGFQGTVSMPESRERLIVVEQNLSMEMQPVGVPGIGEVVYGTRQQLLLVARNWGQERDQCRASQHCSYQHREEGVILHAFKRQLRILRTRYQKHHQWERLVHLGNGVSGKCHLCIDRTSNFKFCCKKVHILQYEETELDIWSELNHPNVVRFYGAIRHGEKIYIFAEFIDGGSLAGMIKEQWLVGRRLSHWTALNYFRQLLQVLTYLQSMGVLHEDIKADNLLLRDSTTEIILADFGAAQRIPHDHTPPNRFPTGSPAHWSPEKAASEGHGFPSDLWASACVLIHMMSGNPPWIGRYPNAGILNFIIWSKPPPMEDVPPEVKESMRDLIACCLVKDKAIRPLARQILDHPAFRLLDQSGSFFSIAQPTGSGPTGCGPTGCGFVGPASDAHQPHPAVEQTQPLQAADQGDEEGAVGSNNHSAPVSVAVKAAPTPSASANVSQVTVSKAAVQPSPHSSSGPQSLPVSLYARAGPARAVQGNHSQQDSPAVQRKSVSTPSAFSTGDGQKLDQKSDQPGKIPLLRKQSLRTLSSSSEMQRPQSSHAVSMTSAGNVFAVESRLDANSTVNREVISQSLISAKSSRSHGEVTVQHIETATSHQQEQGHQGGPSSDNLMPFQPEPWPDVPSPVLTLASQVTAISEARMQSLVTSGGQIQSYTSHSISLISSSSSGQRGQLNQSGEKPGKVPKVTTQQTVPTAQPSTLNVPAPSSFSSPGSSGVSQASYAGQGDSHSNLASYGTSMDSTFPTSQHSHDSSDQAMSRKETLSSQTSAVAHTPEEQIGSSQPSSSASSMELRYAGQVADTLTRVPLTKSHGPPVRLMVSQPGSSTGDAVPHSSPAVSAAPVSLDTSKVNRGKSSVMPNTNTIDHVLSGDASASQPAPTNSDRNAGFMAMYPEYSALSTEDFQVTGTGHGVPHLSVIPEAAEEGSLPSPAQQGSSMGSSDAMMWNYIEDQFSVPAESQDQLNRSLREQAGARPRLQLYAPPPDSIGDRTGSEPSLQQQFLPKFELLHTFSLSDSSTLRSGRNNTSSSEEYSFLHLQSQAQGASGSPSNSTRPSVHIPVSAQAPDEPDYASSQVKSPNNGRPVRAVSEKTGQGNHPLTRGNSDEDRISSGDMFGSGPSNNPGFHEAFQYRQGQQVPDDARQQAYWQQLSPPAELQLTVPTADAASPRLARKNPNLRLNVTKPFALTSTPSRPTANSEVAREAQRVSQSSTLPDSGYSTHTQLQGDEAFQFPGISPLTASPLFSARQNEMKPRSRNESGSSASTPKSSTYDRQEQEWTTLQLQTPGFDMLLAEDPMIASGSEHSSTNHLSLLYDQQGEASAPDQEESSMLSILQEGIGDQNFGGHRLVFTNPEGHQLFDMRVLGRNKGWKELATTFRGKIHKAGFRHFTVMQQDGITPVDYFSPYDPAIQIVTVIEISEQQLDIATICWCDNHLIY